MVHLRLFLAFAPDERFQESLDKANPYFKSQFLGKEEYLQEVMFEEKAYLGKYIPPFPNLEQLEDCEKHLKSLLHRLSPNYPFADNPPRLLALPTS